MSLSHKKIIEKINAGVDKLRDELIAGATPSIDGPTPSSTPRTDAEEQRQTQRYGCFMVKSDFARTLEREITALRAALERALDGYIHVLRCNGARLEDIDGNSTVEQARASLGKEVTP